jgi:peptidoglycan hydrolase-like protein with peptidoglycan-binding domain
MAGQRGQHRPTTRGRHRRGGRQVAAWATALTAGLLLAPVVAQAQTDEPHDHGSGSSSTPSGGSSYGGRSTGPAPLQTLPPDPAFPVPEPPVNEALPEDVDVVPPWQGNVVCDPVDKPGLEAFGALIGEHYDRPGYTTSRSCIDQKSEHYDGRAIDWQLDAYDPADRRIGDAVVTWLTDDDGEMAKRFGIQSIIWNHRAWHSSDETWKGYVGQSPHTDHVHFSFTWDGAMMRTSWWTGEALEEPDYGPCRIVSGAYAAIPLGVRTEPCQPGVVSVGSSGYADIRPGGSGPGLDLVQPLLDVEQTGELDHDTRNALLAWQTEQGVPQTGVLDQLTYAAALGHELPELPEASLAVPLPEHLVTVYTEHRRARLAEGDTGPAVELLQQAIGAEPDGDFGPKTAKAVQEFTEEHPLLHTAEETSTLLWHVLEVRDHPTMPYRAMELEVGDEGQAVAVLQAQLGVDADGKFGPVTAGAVQAAQREADLEQTGVVDGPTWAAVDQGVGAPKMVVADLRGGNVTAPGEDH